MGRTVKNDALMNDSVTNTFAGRTDFSSLELNRVSRGITYYWCLFNGTEERVTFKFFAFSSVNLPAYPLALAKWL